MAEENNSLDFRPLYEEGLTYLKVARGYEMALCRIPAENCHGGRIQKEMQHFSALGNFEAAKICLDRAYELSQPDTSWAEEISKRLEYVQGRLDVLNFIIVDVP